MTTSHRPPAGRLIGLDIGSRRIGVAVCDELQTVASPWGFVNQGTRSIEELRSLVDRFSAVGFVAGLPKSLSGHEGRQAADSRAFAVRLGEALNLPVWYWDERLTTSQAERHLIDSGMRRQQRQEQIDALAASLMLQSFLDRQMHRKRRGSEENTSETY